MISYIKGKIILRGGKFIIARSGNVGFKIFVLPSLNLEEDEVELFTHLNVREDALNLYGFSSYKELELFELLLTVSGVGPKAGMGIMSLADAETIKVVIAKGDASMLTRVSGVGKKTAERVILELKSKFAAFNQVDLEKKSKEISDETDAIEALVGLGYSKNEAQKALSGVSCEIKDVGKRIKMALKELGKNHRS